MERRTSQVEYFVFQARNSAQSGRVKEKITSTSTRASLGQSSYFTVSHYYCSSLRSREIIRSDARSESKGCESESPTIDNFRYQYRYDMRSGCAKQLDGIYVVYGRNLTVCLSRSKISWAYKHTKEFGGTAAPTCKGLGMYPTMYTYTYSSLKSGISVGKCHEDRFRKQT